MWVSRNLVVYMSINKNKIIPFSGNGEGKGLRASNDIDKDFNRNYVEQLYNRYRGSLYRYILGILPGAQHEASEIMQETYVRLLRQDNLKKIEENARAYLFTIATNLVRDAIRMKVNRHQAFHVEFDEEFFESEEASPVSALNWDKSISKLKEALVELPPLTRKIFLLSRFEEMSYSEIAKSLCISTRTVERHMSKAGKKIQVQLRGLV